MFKDWSDGCSLSSPLPDTNIGAYTNNIVYLELHKVSECLYRYNKKETIAGEKERIDSLKWTSIYQFDSFTPFNID